MRKIIDKLPLLMCCCILLSSRAESITTVICFLSAIFVSALCQYCGKGRISLLAEMSYIVASVFFTGAVYFIPLIIYDILCDKRYYLCAASGAVLIYAAVNGLPVISVMLITVYAVIAFVLRMRTSASEELEKKYIESRDSFAELNLHLSDKNRHLRERQDNDIRVATLKERNRIAREIHDNVGHLLSRSILQVGALSITAKDQLQKEGLDALSETLNNAMTTVRRSVHDLHDDSVDMKNAITEAIKPLYDENINVTLDYSVSENVPNNIKFSFISIIKECVSNVIKHSSADSVSVILREHPALYQLVFEDNGGFTGELSGDGIGLSNMRSRVEELGGIITVTHSENGFKIFISIKK